MNERVKWLSGLSVLALVALCGCHWPGEPGHPQTVSTNDWYHPKPEYHSWNTAPNAPQERVMPNVGPVRRVHVLPPLPVELVDAPMAAPVDGQSQPAPTPQRTPEATLVMPRRTAYLDFQYWSGKGWNTFASTPWTNSWECYGMAWRTDCGPRVQAVGHDDVR